MITINNQDLVPVENKLRNHVRIKVLSQIEDQVWEIYSKVREQVFIQLSLQISHAVREQVRY